MEKEIIRNKSAFFDFLFIEKFEAGIKLAGTEIKSIRENNGNVRLADSWVIFRNNKAYLFNAHIAKYSNGNIMNHEETRTRELLLHKNEILKLQEKLKKNDFTVIPVRMYFKDSLIKVEIALSRGRKLFEKKELLKERDLDREAKRDLKNY